MDILKQLNNAMTYIETHLCEEIDMKELSRITLYTKDGFNRFFSYMTGMTLNEYIKRRRLTLAAYELRKSDIKVLDVAVKYGFANADAFTRAFIKQHGITPTKARSLVLPLKVYPPASFQIMIKGAREMKFKIIEAHDIMLRGLSKQFSGTAAERFEQEHIMWAAECDDFTNKICKKIPGVWYGIWNKGKYWIAKSENEVEFNELETIKIPCGTYAVFTTGYGGSAGYELPKLREQIFDAWLADSGYIQISDYEIEIYHLFSKTEKHKRNYEIWIPIQKSYKII